MMGGSYVPKYSLTTATITAVQEYPKSKMIFFFYENAMLLAYPSAVSDKGSCIRVIFTLLCEPVAQTHNKCSFHLANI